MRLAGSAATDFLTAHLTRGEKGLAPFAAEVQIRRLWRSGDTLRNLLL